MKPLIAFVVSILLFLVVLIFAAYGETQLQYNTYKQLYEKNMECRTRIGADSHTPDYITSICGSIPTWNTVIYEEVK